MATVEQIDAMWAKDCVIDRNNLTEETIKTASLHQKYLSMMMEVRNKLIKYNHDYLQMKELRSRYYLGELTKDELEQNGWMQYQGLKPLKSDMQTKLETDSELLKLKIKIQYLENIQYQLENILNQIKGRDWALKNHIEWLKFHAGN